MPAEPRKSPLASKYKVFKRLYPYLWRYRWQLAIGLCFLIATNYLEVRMAVLVGNGADILGPDFGEITLVQHTLLNQFILLIVLMGLGMALSRFWMRKLIIGVSRYVEFAFRNDIFDRLLRQSPSFYDRYRTGDLMSRATSDMEAVRTVIGPAIMYVSNTFALLPLALIQMFRISPKLALVSGLPIALIAPAFYFFKRRIHDRHTLAQELMSDISANIQENLSGVRVIKVAAREDDRSAQFDEVSRGYVDAMLSLTRMQAAFIPMLGFIVGLALLALLWAGGSMIVQGDLTHGELVSFFLLLNGATWPMIALGWVLAQVERGAASMERINALFEHPIEIETRMPADEPAAVSIPMNGDISIRNLTFTFSGAETPSLFEVNLDIPAGTTLGITGPVGCGKSTLAALIARRYNPPRGTVLIDGREILDWPVDDYRRQLGIVDQEPFLFSDTISANIAYGLALDAQGRLPMESVLQASRVAKLDPEVAGFPNGYDTILGERGINLSGGQRQRSALARALARDPRLLILDDALAAVDTHTEEAILRGLRELLGNRTTLLISHRISTMSLADVIIYIERGRIVEQGTHAELLAARGAYWSLAQRQKLADEIEETA